MDLSPFLNSVAGDQNSFNDFLMANSASHQSIKDALNELDLSITSFIIDRIDDENEWLLVHNDVHQQEYDLLGLTGLPDLVSVDLNDNEQYQDWMNRHVLAHQQVNLTLGL